MTQFYFCFLTKILKLSGCVEESTWLACGTEGRRTLGTFRLVFCLHKDRQQEVVLILFKLSQISESEAAVSCLG